MAYTLYHWRGAGSLLVSHKVRQLKKKKKTVRTLWRCLQQDSSYWTASGTKLTAKQRKRGRGFHFCSAFSYRWTKCSWIWLPELQSIKKKNTFTAPEWSLCTAACSSNWLLLFAQLSEKSVLMEQEYGLECHSCHPCSKLMHLQLCSVLADKSPQTCDLISVEYNV